MSERARSFLGHWFATHLQSLPEALRLGEAVRLATQCRKDATAAGIPLSEVREAVGGDLIRKLLAALEAAAGAEAYASLAPEIAVADQEVPETSA